MQTRGGPQHTQYNHSKRGWFNNYCFNSWFRTEIMPQALRKEGQKVVIGGNLLTHFDTHILKLCKDHGISFVCLVPNITHILQLLDVAFYGPLKKKWQKILKEWKLKNHTQTTPPKVIFPVLLKQLISVLDTDNLKSGFRSCGAAYKCVGYR